ncbi:hypothetical protein FRX31_013716 [Thalictrum thalictroides]|uniref:Uncharacterized protein n=1 Tax=Thalictrum thalictroides TaxID=46969 RepID=A0A7J6WIE4_THATH|nr:hypothetical protein FRX31_013716 [Thalictrum thalictroides]
MGKKTGVASHDGAKEKYPVGATGVEPKQTNTDVRKNEGGPTYANKSRGVADQVWVQVPGIQNLNKSEKEKSWAQVVSGRFEVIRDVTEEMQDRTEKQKGEAQNVGPEPDLKGKGSGRWPRPRRN